MKEPNYKMKIKRIGAHVAEVTHPRRSNLKFIMDYKDIKLLGGHTWNFIGKRKYVYTRTALGDKVFLQNLMLGKEKKSEDQVVAFIDGNPHNLRRSNLRIMFRSEVCHNREWPKENTSGFRGVHWADYARKYRCNINCSGVRYELGLFTDKVEAAKAYNKMAKKLYGKLAKLNPV